MFFGEHFNGEHFDGEHFEGRASDPESEKELHIVHFLNHNLHYLDHTVDYFSKYFISILTYLYMI